MATEPKIEAIVAELHRRLKVAYPRVYMQRGFFAEENTIWPAIYIVEDVISSGMDRTKNRGKYDRVAAVSVSYFFKGPTDLQQALKIANIEKFNLCNVIEADEDFIGLCTHYHEVEFDKIFYKANGIQVSVEYAYEYAEEAPWVTATARRM